MKPITYSLQFRGHAADAAGELRKQAGAPGCALVTSLTPSGIETGWVWSPDDEEALLESTVVLGESGRFNEEGTIHFSPSHALQVRGTGRLTASPDPHLRHGASIWDVVGGRGQFDGARGRITSNFFLSDTGELTENQLGVVFPAPTSDPHGVGPGTPPARATSRRRDHRDTARLCGLDRGGRHE